MELHNADVWPTTLPHSNHPYGLYELSTSPSMSASSTMSEFELFPPTIYHSCFSSLPPDDVRLTYNFPLTPSEFGSPEHGPLNSPRNSISVPLASPRIERTHATSGRRRAQNRAAQRSFRERKEKYARDLEQKLAELTEKYQTLESSHRELTAAHEKLGKTLELLSPKGEDDESSKSAETLRNFLALLHGEIKVKAEQETTS